ncbi:MAG: MFS transporter [Deltaproteobacteria bacterium]|nr:MFS transporter [Deltaproteobacteria bacterium]
MTDAALTVGFFHPSRGLFRFLVLIVAGSLTYGSYFAYDSVGALAPTLIQAWQAERESIGWLYTLYSVAAIVSVFFGGVLTDRIGTRRASLVFSALIVIGACIVASAPSILVACVGRFIFGAGSESLVVAQNAILSRWFRGRELALSFGITLAIARLGTLFSFNTESLIASRFSWQAALWAAAGLCVLSLVANLLYFVMDKAGEKALGLADATSGDKIVLADIKKFGASYWYVVFLCVTFYSAIFPFTALSTDFFHEKWGLPLTTDSGGGSFIAAAFADFMHMFSTAPGTSSIIIFASMCLAPFAGGLVDRIGRRASLMLVGALLMIPCHLLLGFTMLAPYYPMLLLGASFVLVPAALWPAVPLIVDKNRVGTAFGLMTMIQNIGLAFFPWLNGKLRDATQDYRASMAMFACLGLVGFVFALLLKRADQKAGGILDRGRAAQPAA